jgi:hypothetical protein
MAMPSLKWLILIMLVALGVAIVLSGCQVPLKL